MATIGSVHFQPGTVSANLYDVISEGTGRTVGRVVIMSNGLWTVEEIEPVVKYHTGSLNQIASPRTPPWNMDADTAQHLWNNWKFSPGA
jgi:hypothetical protein